MNDLSWVHVVEAAQCVYRKAVLLSDGVKRFPGTDLVVAAFRQGKRHSRDGRWRLRVIALFGRGGWFALASRWGFGLGAA